ncbi:MAG: hypothetical protein M1834_002755 [Cirrosporium novae-zelandiae]|nr:MAG: hypothetical protein M1834_002755 [Cirrosporium novae-zelandiae]
MADISKASNGPSPYSAEGFDPELLPDFHTDFLSQADVDAFEKALGAPQVSPVIALNDWRPVRQIARKKSKRHKRPVRSKDETREGHFYPILRYPLLIFVFGWLVLLVSAYTITRLYIYAYEHFVAWTGKRERYRQKLRSATNYADWLEAAQELDHYLGNDQWKETDEYAYYDSLTVKNVTDQLVKLRLKAEEQEEREDMDDLRGLRPIDELKNMVEACVKNNFCGIENPRLYSEAYYGTKQLVQDFIEECHASLRFLLQSSKLTQEAKYVLSRRLDTQLGRTALCLSGGACFAYYHFGIIKSLLDSNLLPDVITGTSGGALVASLIGTRTNDELKKLLVPALAYRITACEEGMSSWIKRWYRTGARFDSIEWAKKSSWFTRGSLTFREAYERTGRILNVSCVPSDPHSPTILNNYLTSPDCVIWSAVLASAAVPGILNPIVLMKKNPDGSISPYSFGHKWKDGSLRTDIPLKALNLHFNVNFSLVSQVNPHVNLFFFSSRGSVGRPVTHRKGRGWRGGFLGSAAEQYLKLDFIKWLKVLRHLELLPRPAGQDWSEVWLQRFEGTITVWPRGKLTDFMYILTDPTPERLSMMLQVGQQSTFPKLKFLANRMLLERAVIDGLRSTAGEAAVHPDRNAISDLKFASLSHSDYTPQQANENSLSTLFSNSRRVRVSSEFAISTSSGESTDDEPFPRKRVERVQGRAGSFVPSVLEELRRQSRVFFDDAETTGGEDSEAPLIVNGRKEKKTTSNTEETGRARIVS